MASLDYLSADPRLYLAGQLKQSADSFANQLYNKTEDEAQAERDRALRQNYIERERSLRLLPQLNSAIGNTGGLSETSLINLATGYSSARSTIEAAYLSFIESAREALTSQIFNNNQDYLNTQIQIAATTPTQVSAPATAPTPAPVSAPVQSSSGSDASAINRIKDLIANTTSKRNTASKQNTKSFNAKKNIGMRI